MTTFEELDALSSHELHDRAVKRAERHLDVKFFWRLLQEGTAADAAEGDLERGEEQTAHWSRQVLDTLRGDEAALEARRPIYIECTNLGFKFLPENERIGAAALEGSHEGYNPLLAGARALVRYWAAKRRASPDSEAGQAQALAVALASAWAFLTTSSWIRLGSRWYLRNSMLKLPLPWVMLRRSLE